MMAAIAAVHAGADVVLLEKMERVGKKLAITGKGRCNITSAVPGDELVKGFPGQGRFLYSVFNQFSNQDLIKFFNDRGLATKIERGLRVFPVSDQAGDVVKVLYDELVGSGVRVHLKCPVKNIYINDNAVQAVQTSEQTFPADAVIIGTGGLSYPGTGSTGDGYKWARQAGHRIEEPRPGLVPLLVKESWVQGLQGLSLKNVRAAAYDTRGRKINEDFGELLFTHFGLSGPIILSMSHDIGKYLQNKHAEITLKIDLKPALSEDKLDERIQRDFAKYSRKILKNSLHDLMPRKLIPLVISLSGIDPDKECHHITRGERSALVDIMKGLSLTVNGTRPVAEAIVTAGGVNVKEINPKTMESKLVRGLFFAGEVLDVDGYTGGYNLQAAFSTGYVAGRNAARY
jgi:hypothetical protein